MIQHLTKTFTRALFGLALLPLTASAQLSDVSLEYTLKVSGAKLGTLVANLSVENDTFRSTSETRAEGLASILLGGDLSETCEFSFDGSQVISQSYVSSKKGRGAYENVTEFDWENRKLKFGPEDEITLDMPAGYIVDNCNMPFAAALSKGVLDNEQPFYIVDATRRRVRGYLIQDISKETINTRIGDLTTTKIEMQRESNPKRTLTLWLAEDKQHMLVRMIEKRSSRTTVMEIESLEGV